MTSCSSRAQLRAHHRAAESRLTDQRKRTLITSPIDGVVKNMRFTTLGGVVKAGEPIMEIVPTTTSS
ncbi:MAG: HlyD family efflux transporter periplasmic adaptor subunit [Pseudomonadota bacterium]